MADKVQMLNVKTQVIEVNAEQQVIVAKPHVNYDFRGENLQFWQAGDELWVYQNGQIKVVVQDYSHYFQHAPIQNGAMDYIATTNHADYAATAVTEPEMVAPEASHVQAGTYTGTSAPSHYLLFGGLGLLALGGLAAAAGGGKSHKDSPTPTEPGAVTGEGTQGKVSTLIDKNVSTTADAHSTSGSIINDNSANHTGSVSANTTLDGVWDGKSEVPYFIKALLPSANASLGYLKDAILGHGIKVSYAFATENYDSQNSLTLTGFKTFSAQQKADLKDAMTQYSQYANIEFTETTSDKANFTIFLDDLADAQDEDPHDHGVTLGWAQYGGNVHLYSTAYGVDNAFAADVKYILVGDDLQPYSSGRETFIHELGHSLGMTHPFDEPFTVDKAEDNTGTSIMSYTAWQHIDRVDIVEKDGKQAYYKDVDLSQNTLSVFDIAMMTFYYGVNAQYNSGDNSYTFGKFDASVSTGNVLVVDGAGNDVIDASNQTEHVFIDLAPGTLSYVGDKAADTLAYDSNGNPTENQLFISYGSIIESAKGGSGDDTLIGNDADNYLFGFNGHDELTGGAGNDQLEGGLGQDVLIGSDGADQFIFASTLDGYIDTIQDFSAVEGDSIVLNSAIFDKLTANESVSEHFVFSSDTQDFDDYLIYDQTSGVLAYDADGSGAGAAVAFAKLTSNLMDLDATQIVVV